MRSFIESLIMYSRLKWLTHRFRWITGLSISILSSLCHSWGNFKFFSLSFLRYFGLKSYIWLCKYEFYSKYELFLYSDIPIPVIICNTSVGNWAPIIFLSLSILFPMKCHNYKIKSFALTIVKTQEEMKKLSKYLW